MAKSPPSTSVKLTPKTAEPRADVIKCLEMALERAKNGELRSVVIIGDVTGNRFFSVAAAEDRVTLLGHIQIANMRIMEGLMD